MGSAVLVLKYRLCIARVEVLLAFKDFKRTVVFYCILCVRTHTFAEITYLGIKQFDLQPVCGYVLEVIQEMHMIINLLN